MMVIIGKRPRRTNGRTDGRQGKAGQGKAEMEAVASRRVIEEIGCVEAGKLRAEDWWPKEGFEARQ